MKNKKNIVVILLIIIVIFVMGVTIFNSFVGSDDNKENIFVSDKVISYADINIGGSGILRTYDEYLKLINNKNLNMVSDGTDFFYNRIIKANPGKFDEDYFESYDYLYYFDYNDCSYDVVGVKDIDFDNNSVSLYKMSTKCMSEFSVKYVLYLIPVEKNKLSDSNIYFDYEEYNSVNKVNIEYDLYVYYSNDVDISYKGLLKSKIELDNLIDEYNLDIKVDKYYIRPGDTSYDTDFNDNYYAYYIMQDEGCLIGYNKVKNVEITEWDSINIEVYKENLKCIQSLQEYSIGYKLLLVPLNKNSINKDYDIEFNFLDKE